MADSVPPSPTPSATFAAALKAAIMIPLQASSFGSSVATTPTIPSEEITPSLDRSVDVQVCGFVTSSYFNDFTQALPIVAAGAQSPAIFLIPLWIRHLIYEFMFPISPDEAKITLSPEFATKAVFPDDYFLVPDEILQDVAGALSACRQLRDEVMTYFWTTYEFHITLSPFTAPMTSPLSQQWLPLYADRVQNLTIEIDLTRFGLGSLPTAALLGASTEKMTGLIKELVDSLSYRRGTMFFLHLMCRRYGGSRAQKKNEHSTQPVLYCPIEAMTVCDSVFELQGILMNLRMTGFTPEYTDHIMKGLFGLNGNEPVYLAPLNDAWPVELPTPATQFPLMNASPAVSFQASSTATNSPALSFPASFSTAAHSPPLSMLNEPGLAARLGLNSSKQKGQVDEFDKKTPTASYDQGYEIATGSQTHHNLSPDSPSIDGSEYGSHIDTPRADFATPGNNFQNFADSYIASHGSFAPMDMAQYKGKGKGKANDFHGPAPPTPTESIDSDKDYIERLVAEMNFDKGPLSPEAESLCQEADRVAAKYASELGSTGAGGSSSKAALGINSPFANINDPTYLQESDLSYDAAGRSRSDSSKKRFSKFIDKLKGGNA